MVERTAELGFPKYAVEAGTVARAEACLDDETLDTGLRRQISDSTDDLKRVLRSREAFPR
jgi:hypothetical protein